MDERELQNWGLGLWAGVVVLGAINGFLLNRRMDIADATCAQAVTPPFEQVVSWGWIALLVITFGYTVWYALRLIVRAFRARSQSQGQ